jgi:hypothetical protein
MHVGVRIVPSGFLHPNTNHDHYRTMMDISGFLSFVILAVLVILISAGLDRLFAHVVPFRLFYYALRLPGVVLHEVAHVGGCMVAGAEIKKVVLFSKTGGSVTYTEPKIPLFGTVIISSAPLFALPLVLAGLTWIFGTYFNCYVPPVFPQGLETTSALYGMVHEVITIFSINLLSRFNGWFLVYLYLVGSIILSLAPSEQDLRNAAVGIGIIFTLCLFVLWSGFLGAGMLISLIITPMNTAFSIGLMFEMITAVISVPFVLIFAIVRV